MSLVAPASTGLTNSLLDQHGATPEPISARLKSKLLWSIIPPLFLTYSLIIIDRSNVAVAQLGGPNNTAPHGMAQPVADGGLGLTQTAFGLASGIFFGGYALMQVPSNHLLLRLGARRVLGCCTLLSGLLSASTALATNLETLCVLRFLLGLAEAGFYPGALLYVSLWFPDAHMGEATAAFSMGAVAGGFAGNIVSGFMMSAADGLGGLAGWRWLFFFQGVPTALVGLGLLCVLSDAPRDARFLSADEREQLVKALAHDGGGRRGRGNPHAPLLPALRAVVCRARTWVLALQYFVGANAAYLQIFFMPKMWRELLPPATPLWLVGVAASAPGLLLIVAAPLGAAAVERAAWGTPTRRRFVATWLSHGAYILLLLGGGIGLLAAAPVVDDPGPRRHAAVAMVLALAVGQLISGVAAGSFWALHHAIVDETPHISIAFVNCIGNLGGFVGPFVLGWLHDQLGPPCPAGETACVGQWGWGSVVLASGLLVLTCATAVAAHYTGVAR